MAVRFQRADLPSFLVQLACCETCRHKPFWKQTLATQQRSVAKRGRNDDVHNMEAREFQERLQRLEALLQDAERGRTRRRIALREIVQSSSNCIARDWSECLSGWTRRSVEACAGDEIVEGMLLLHGLHPSNWRHAYVRRWKEWSALGDTAAMSSLLEVARWCCPAASARNCHGCPSSSATMRQTVEEAIVAKAPDVDRSGSRGLNGRGIVNGERPGWFALPLLSRAATDKRQNRSLTVAAQISVRRSNYVEKRSISGY